MRIYVAMETLSKKEFIEAFPVFSKAADKLVSDLLSVSLLKKYPKNLRVYTEGDACNGIAFLLSGEIRVFKSGEAGREITLYEIGKGETCILNASCILSSLTYPANAVSTEPGDMLLILSQDFRRLIATYEDMRNFVFNILSQRLAEVMALVEEIAFGRMDRRLLDYLVEKSDHNQLMATHQKIADDLGTSREVVSRLLKDYERKGRISLSRNLIELKTT
jgi:CRP/FNR family transcriptional regulator